MKPLSLWTCKQATSKLSGLYLTLGVVHKIVYVSTKLQKIDPSLLVRKMSVLP